MTRPRRRPGRPSPPSAAAAVTHAGCGPMARWPVGAGMNYGQATPPAGETFTTISSGGVSHVRVAGEWHAGMLGQEC